MLRTGLAMVGLLVGSSAWACAMPQRAEASLAQAMEEIDGPAPVAVVPVAPVKPVVAQPATAPTFWEQVSSAVTDLVIPEVAAQNSPPTAVPVAVAKSR